MAAHLMTFDKRGEGDQVIDADVLLEVTEARKDGFVEIVFTDRNERCYLKFRLSELIDRVLLLTGSAS